MEETLTLEFVPEFVAIWAVGGPAGLETAVLDIGKTVAGMCWVKVKSRGWNLLVEGSCSVGKSEGDLEDSCRNLEVCKIHLKSSSVSYHNFERRRKMAAKCWSEAENARAGLAVENVQVEGCQMQVGCSRSAVGMFLAELKICREAAWWEVGGEGMWKNSCCGLGLGLNIDFWHQATSSSQQNRIALPAINCFSLKLSDIMEKKDSWWDKCLMLLLLLSMMTNMDTMTHRQHDTGMGDINY
ncbi:hypothetical protein M5K25_026154 [Dendrobium thyrsiflorum]|uniref:Uncharacterized protein n=1 Tax=Dendrobium thyrsiflorum TaxID=117978 RepID=A0ABD0TWW1_DENTH